MVPRGLDIDGEHFDVDVFGVNRTADFLDRYAKRTDDGVLHRELIGVYINYELQIGAPLHLTEYDRLWHKLTETEEFHTVTVPGEGGQFTFTAYFSSVKDHLLLVDRQGKVHWDGLAVKFIAKAPART